jgi:hypothetical protein
MLKKKIPNAAIPLFREAIAAGESRDPTRALMRFHLAQAYVESGSVRQAVAELELALQEAESFPGREDAQALLERLRTS